MEIIEELEKQYSSNQEFNKKNEYFQEALDLIKYFVKRVEEGSIKSKTTYQLYKDFLNKCNNENS